MAHVVVIDATVAGLACSARLQAAGHRVTVATPALTQNECVGVHQRDGFIVAATPTALTVPAAFVDLFAKTGTPLDQHVEIRNASCGYAVRIGNDSYFSVPDAGIGAWAEVLGHAHGSQTATEWREAMTSAAAMWSAARPSHTKPTNRRPRWRLRREPTLRTFSNNLLSDKRTRTFLEWFAVRDGLDPRKTTRSSAVVPYLEQTFGLHEIAGGLPALHSALFERCISLGVEFEFASPVSRVVVSDGRLRGVELADSEYLTCDFLVHTPPPQGCTPFTVLLGISGSVDLPTRSVWLPQRPEEELTEIFDNHSRAVDPSMTVTVSTDGVPENCAALTINVPQTQQHAPDEGWYADHLVRVLAQRGLDLHRRVLWQHTVAPVISSKAIPRATGIITANCEPIPGANVSLEALAGEGVYLAVGRA